MSRSSLIAGVTFGSVACSAVVSLVWFVSVSGVGRFEPTVQTLGLLAGITGVLAERRATARERRQLTLASLNAELLSCASALTDSQFTTTTGDRPRRRVYRRLPISATDSALTSGALAERSDGELLGRLHQWRDAVNGFNRRLDLTELRIFLTDNPNEVRQFNSIFHGNDGYLDRLRLQLADLQQYLATKHGTTLPT
jgi:hypothetical protein